MIELDWRRDAATLDCLVCRFTGEAVQVAEVNALGRVGIEVVRCPDCGSVRMSGEVGDVTPDDASVDAYVEAGAGIDAIASGLDVPDPRAVRRMLDVGCNYGFGMDVGRFLHGWEVVGAEPSLAGRRGAAELGLDIRDGYVTSSTTFEAPFDLVLASEVVEHVPDPLEFLRVLARQLTPQGVLVLTTPAAEAVSPDAPSEHVLIALSPGFHSFLASSAGLDAMLREVGFRSVSVRRDGGTLRARASLDPDVTLERASGAPLDRVALERYYDERARGAATGSALANGMATRHLRSAVNRGDWAVARSSAPRAVAALRERHGFDLDEPSGVLAALRDGATPAWNLTGLAYALGMLKLLAEDRPDRAADLMDVALTSIDAWRAHAGLLDGDSADLRTHAARHRALAAVRARPDDVAAALGAAAAYLDAPARDRLVLDLFVDLVSRGRHGPAGTLSADAATLARAAVGSVDAGVRRAGLDALYCLATHRAASGDLDGSQEWTREARAALAAEPEPVPVLEAGLAAHEATLVALRAAPAHPGTPALPGTSMHPRAAVRPAHAVDVYWVDAAGTYVSGWAHHGDEPVVTIALQRREVSVSQAPTLRPDLVAFWPEVPQVAEAGFALYLPGPPDGPVDLVLTTATGSLRTRLDLPRHPLPPPVLDASGAGQDAFTNRFRDLVTSAPPGPVLAIGLRGEDLVQRDALQAVLGDRELVVVDIHPGAGVDVVADAHDLEASLDRQFAMVYSAMLLEHVVAPWMLAGQVNRVLLPGGLSAHVAPTAWPEHAQPNDFWRFTTAGLAELFGPRTGFEVLATGSYGELRLQPVGPWLREHLTMPTLATPGSSWVVARKTRHLADDEVRWPYDVEEGRRVARLYPVGGLAPTGTGELLALTSTDSERVCSPGVTSGTTAPPEPAPAAAAAGPEPEPDDRLTVSVVLPLYDGEAYLATALRSLTTQTRLPDELVVVDDGSTDGGLQIVLDADLPFPLTVVRQANQGQSAARNAGIRVARGDAVAFIDQDDEWRRTHLAQLVPILERDPDLGWVYSDFEELDGLGRTVTRSFIEEARIPHPKTTLTACLSGDLMVLPSASVLRTEAVRAVGGFDPRLRGYEDDDLFVRMFAAGWGHEYLPLPTIRYRVHVGGSSSGMSFLRSRMIYLSKLTGELEPDHRRNRDFVHDVVLPRFFQTTLNDYSQAIALREYPAAIELAAALGTITDLAQQHGWRRRLELWFLRHPRRMRFLLLRVERLPSALRPTLNRDLRILNRTSVRAELRAR
ncbi:glycosyltransferase [Actinotalea ferrariae]|uniref:glycosyltransferase n=1 Tax=Actinotalea ferrariae TaxID=1386098 RepID=UPI001C8BF298|nr:glycosyltransferase [Actinotalea ferrariae]MBX9245491.1 glycosyltransferase [Actinotalea ferrariae]